jgi:glycosyltransferase involved in cell wall biosynthesis
MTILILNWRDIKHPLSGGAESSLFEHAKYWQKHGASVIWFTSSFPGAQKEEIIDNIRIIRKGSQFTVHIHAFVHFNSFLKDKIDIIIDNFHFIPFFTPLYAGNKKIIAFIHEPAREAWFKNINIVVALLGYVLEPLFFLPYRHIKFLTVSLSVASELPLFGISKKQITVIPNGVTVDLSIKVKKNKTPTVLYLAQLSQDKGIEDAIKMFAIIKKGFSSTIFLVAGRSVNEKYKKKIFQLVETLKLTQKDIKFLGFVSEKAKYKLLQEAWVLVHPSIREGWGLTVIEAASFGTPTVGYRVTGLSDSIQHMQTGILANKNTPEELAKEVIKLFNDKELYTKLSKQAKKFAKSFNWEKSGEQSFSIIKEIYEQKS